MWFVALCIFLGQLVAAGAAVVVARREISRAEERIRERILQFVTAAEPGQISPLAELTEVIAARFANHMVASIKAQLYNAQSHVARQELALQSDIALDAATQQSPLVGLLAGAFPSVTKRIMKNPSALPALVSLLQKMGSGGQGQLSLFGPGHNGSDSSGPGGSVADRIKRQR